MQLETIAAVMNGYFIMRPGQTASNPFISALKKFREEFEEHNF
jgi:NADH:ubiquinone oxidoreductase subunit F (NADH-binding)